MGSRRIQIWYLIGNLEIGGAETTLISLANGLDPKQFDVTIWTIENSNPLAEGLNESITLRTLDTSGKVDLRTPIKFARAVRKKKPDIIQSFLFYDNTLAVPIGKLTGDTSVITGVRAIPNKPSLLKSFIRRIVHPRANQVVSNSRKGAQFIIEHGVNPSLVEVIHNGRDIDKYANGNATNELYTDLGLENSNLIIGTVGRLVERKGHYDLLNAWPTVLDAYPDAQLLLVGNGPEREGLIQKSRELDCADSVCFAGRRNDVPDLLDAMDVFVFPSHYEGLPGALMEAMIAGLPIVATPVDGNSELIEDGITGLFVPPHDSEAIAARLNEIMADPELQMGLGTSASEYAQEEFAIENMVSKFGALYKEMVADD